MRRAAGDYGLQRAQSALAVTGFCHKARCAAAYMNSMLQDIFRAGPPVDTLHELIAGISELGGGCVKESIKRWGKAENSAPFSLAFSGIFRHNKEQ